jgi:CHASE3 domain sensor protein
MLVVVTIIALGAVAYLTERAIATGRDAVIHTYRVSSQFDELQLEMIRAHAGENDYALTGEEARTPRSQQPSQSARQTVENLRELTRDDPQQQERLAGLGPLLEQEMTLIESGHGPSGSGAKASPAQRNRQTEIDNLDHRLDGIVRGMQEREEALLQQRLADWDYLFKRNVLLLGVSFAVVALMLAYNFWLLIAEVARTRAAAKTVRDNAESYKLMSARILELQDSERRRIARNFTIASASFWPGSR